jgi:hypothetical protein
MFLDETPGFHDVVASSWNELVSSPCPLERISMKLKRLAKGGAVMESAAGRACKEQVGSSSWDPT